MNIKYIEISLTRHRQNIGNFKTYQKLQKKAQIKERNAPFLDRKIQYFEYVYYFWTSINLPWS